MRPQSFNSPLRLCEQKEDAMGPTMVLKNSALKHLEWPSMSGAGRCARSSCIEGVQYLSDPFSQPLMWHAV